MTTTTIDQYEVMYSSNTFPPRIWLKSGGKFVGQLIFEADGKTLPADGMSAGSINLYYHLEDFRNTMNLLSRDKPIYLLYNGSGSGFENGIMTTPEQVGT